MGRGCKAEGILPWWGAAVRPQEYRREGRSAHKSSNTASKQQSTGFEPGKWQPRALTEDNVLNNSSRHANRLPLRAKSRKHRREAWIAVRRMKPILAVRQRKIDIAVRRESPSGGKKSIFAVRQRKNWYRREAWIAVRRKEIDSCHEAKKKSIIAVRRRKNWLSPWGEEKLISQQWKNWLRGNEKIDCAAMKKLTARRWKNQLHSDEKIDCAAMKKSAVAESSYWKLEHHLRGEQKRKLCLLDNYLGNSPKLSETEGVVKRSLSDDIIKGTDRPIPPSTRDLVP